MSEKPVSPLTRLAIQQFLAIQNAAADELARSAAETEGVTLDGKVRLDLQRGVWVFPDDASSG